MLNLNTNRSPRPLPQTDHRSSWLHRPAALCLVAVAVAMVCSGGCPAGAPDEANGFLGDLSGGGETGGNSGTADAGNGSDPATAGDGQENGLHVPNQQVFAMQGDSVDIVLRLDGGAEPGDDVRYAIVVAPAFGIITAGETREINTATLIYTPPADFAGQTAISYVARTNSGESNVATVSITVYPQVRFGVETLDERGLSVRGFAATVGGHPLPEGTYVWRFDDVEDAGLMSTHSERTYTFADAGIHTISLTIILAGLQGPIACRSINDSELEVRKHVTPVVSGRVRLADGQPVAGVSVGSLDRSVGGTTDEKGKYRFDVPLYWSGQVWAARDGYRFTPASIQIGDVVRDVRNANFTAAKDTGSKAPTAHVQAVRTSQDTDVLITLTGSDPENDPLTFIVATLPAHGALFDAQRGYRIAPGDLPYALASSLANYSPAAGYAGADVFRFRVSDGPNQSPDVDVSIEVGQANRRPVAHSQDVRVAEDRNVVVKLTGSDPDNDPLKFIIVALPTHGVLDDDAESMRRIGDADLPYLLSADSVRYTPQANYVGGDRFTFKVNDGGFDSAAAGVNLTVDGVNDAPQVEQRNPFVLTVNKDSKRTDPFNQFQLSAIDVDAAPNSLTWKITIAPSHGSAWLEGGSPSSSGQPVQFSYEPTPAFTGRDGFTVEVSDADGLSSAIGIDVAVGGYLLTGVIRDYNGDPSPGVPVAALDSNNNPWQTRTSDSNGRYEFLVPPSWSGTLTSDANHRFEPAAKAYANVNGSSAQDFTAFRNYYVATTGNDGSPGFIDAEFATIQRGVNATGPGDTVIIKAGTYPERVQIRANVNKTGLPGQPITIQSENWYPGAAHDRALDVIIDGTGEHTVLGITDRQQYIVLRGLIIENAANNNLIIANSHHITIEDCITRYAFTNGITVSSRQGPERYILIRRSVIYNNGNSGVQFRGSAFGVSDSLVEDCDSFENGAEVPENAEGFEVYNNLVRNVTFRRCLAYKNLSSNFAAVDPVNFTVEDCIGWGTTRIGDADGRSFIAGLHGEGSGTVVRHSVSFDSPRLGMGLLGSQDAAGYNNTVFDCGFDRPGEVPAPKKTGFQTDQRRVVVRNTCAFDNAFNFNGDPDPSARDFRADTDDSDLDSDYNLIKDGVGLEQHGPNTLTVDPADRQIHDDQLPTNGRRLVVNKATARQLADAYADAAQAGTTTWSVREQFLSDIAAALRPAPGSPLTDAGSFLVFTASAGTNTTVILLDRDPRRFFREGIPDIDSQGDLIQIDDGDGNPATMTRVRIVSMTASSITVERPVSFSAGTGIHVPYTGNVPDIGAFEAE